MSTFYFYAAAMITITAVSFVAAFFVTRRRLAPKPPAPTLGHAENFYVDADRSRIWLTVVDGVTGERHHYWIKIRREEP